MRRNHLLLALGCLVASSVVPQHAEAVGDAATKYNVFVPAGANSARPSFLVVTNVSPFVATVDVIDDSADGDTDDTILGAQLSPGDSQIVRIKDGAVNDDAGGVHDGDFFRIRSDQTVIALMGSASSWEHDWAPAADGGGIGKSFFVYALPLGNSTDIPDLDVFAYDDATTVTVTDVTTTAVVSSGRATVNLGSSNIVLKSELQLGEDLNIRRNGLGLDALVPGHTYWVQATGRVSVQTGHLGSVSGGNQARDGGGFVPSANGSSLGSLFFFQIPHELGLAREKELRVVCPQGGVVSLYGANSGSAGWTLISSQNTTAGQHLDYVGSSNDAFRSFELYKMEVSPSYLGCHVFEANWLETGSQMTSDVASVVSSDEGSGVGYGFTAYIGPPSQYNNRPSAALLSNIPIPDGTFVSHLWVYATENSTGVTVTDLDTNGSRVNTTFTVNADQYYDFAINQTMFSLLSSPGSRPYLRVSADKPITVVAGNINDNWQTYFQSALPPFQTTRLTVPKKTLRCGEAVNVTVSCDNTRGGSISGVVTKVVLPTGVIATGFGTAPTSSAAGTIAWNSPALAGGSALSFDMTVTLDCSALACEPSGLSALRATCSGTSSSTTYSSTADASVDLVDDSRLSIDSFAVRDVPDYLSPTPSPRTRVEFTIAGGTSGIVKLERVVGSASTTQVQTALLTVTAAGNYTFDDPYALHYEETRFYRLRILEGACTRLEGPISLKTSSGQSGGVSGGLESNGRLASAIARRHIAQSHWSTAPLMVPSRSARETKTADSGLLALLPIIGPDGATRSDATPTDLPDITNASSVAAADYYDADGDRVATLLLVGTQGEVYEHSKALCDRAGGSHIDFIGTETTQSAGSMIRALYRNERMSTGESAIELKLYEQPDGGYRAYSRWLPLDYPAVAPGQRVLNLQAWSRKPGMELATITAVLETLGTPVLDMVSVPPGHFSVAMTMGGKIDYVLAGPEPTNLSLRTTRSLENGSTESEMVSLTSSSGELAYAPFTEAYLELVDAQQAVVDRVWISDGAWASLDDALWGGDTVVKSQSQTGCPERGPNEDGDLQISGCASISANVADFAGVARHIGGAYSPLDISAYQAVSFSAMSSAPFHVCLEQVGVAREAQLCAYLPAFNVRTNVVLPLSAFVDRLTCSSSMIRSLQTLTFTTTQQGSVDMAIDTLSFSARAPLEQGTLTEACLVAPQVPSEEGAPTKRGCSATGSMNENGLALSLLVIACYVLSRLRSRRLAWRHD